MKKFYLPPHLKKSLLADVKKLVDSGKERGHGFVKYTSTYREMLAFKHKSGVVVKQPSCIICEATPKSVRIPTIYLGGGWVAQPVAKKVRLREAMADINLRLIPYLKRDIYPDVHTGNVGWYDGKAVLFDW